MTNREFVAYEKKVIDEVAQSKKLSFKLLIKVMSLSNCRVDRL